MCFRKKNKEARIINQCKKRKTFALFSFIENNAITFQFYALMNVMRLLENTFIVSKVGPIPISP